MSRIVHAASGHTLAVTKISRAELPENIRNDQFSSAYKDFWVVQNWDVNGPKYFYLGRGADSAPREIVAWFAKSGSFWSSYGKTFEDAINGAQRDGWMYA